MRGLTNLDYGKKILITNGVKKEFKNIEIQERARPKLYVNKGYQAVNKIRCLGLGELFLLTFGFKESFHSVSSFTDGGGLAIMGLALQLNLIICV